MGTVYIYVSVRYVSVYTYIGTSIEKIKIDETYPIPPPKKKKNSFNLGEVHLL